MAAREHREAMRQANVRAFAEAVRSSWEVQQEKHYRGGGRRGARSPVVGDEEEEYLGSVHGSREYGRTGGGRAARHHGGGGYHRRPVSGGY